METLPALAFLAAVYCIGGLHGLWLAWSQPSRMRRWASLVDCTQERYYEVRDAKRGAQL